MRRRSAGRQLIAFLGVVALVGTACAPPAPPAPTQAPTKPTVQPTAAPAAPAAQPTTALPQPAATQPPAPTAAPAAKPAVATPAAQGQQPKRGGVLRIASDQPAPTYDAHSDLSSRIIYVTAHVFSRLVRSDPASADVSVATLKPDLAERWEVSQDGLTYTFQLRQGVKFHDGKPFSADDVVYSLEKWKDPTKSYFAALVPMMKRVEKVDDRTVKIHLEYAYPDFLLYLLYADIQAKHLSNVPFNSTDAFIGTGPFKFKSTVPGSQVTLERNPDYFVSGLPYVDQLDVVLLNANAALDAFIAGRLEAVSFRTGVNERAHVERVTRFAPQAVVSYPVFPVVHQIVFNMQRDGPWQDVRIRRAMAMVLDRDELVLAARGDAKLAKSGGIYPPNIAAARPVKDVLSLHRMDGPIEMRATDAKRLMAEAGYPDGFSFTIRTRDNPAYWRAVLLAADAWKRYLNVEARIDFGEIAAFLTKRAEGDYDMLYEGLLGPFGSVPEEFTRSYTTGSADNWAKWSNAQFDQWHEQLIRLKGQEKLDLARKMEDLIFTEVPVISGLWTTSGNAVQPYVRGWVLQPLYTSVYNMDHVWLDR